ncbi:helix-turn-helix transcriptional regulator [Flavobacteriaceae bacterium]|nr:helix-turn-helix transcriptional regulator [Flavobacteriaceae bacterium]
MTPSTDKIEYSDDSPTCACKVSLDYLGDKWILIIIRDLFRQRFTFTHFLKESKEKIATNILSDRLKKLQKLELINFRLNEDNKKIKEYYLTNKGVELYDIIFQLQLWSVNNVNFTFSENTKKWVDLTNKISKEEVIRRNKEKYIKFRKKMFGF